MCNPFFLISNTSIHLLSAFGANEADDLNQYALGTVFPPRMGLIKGIANSSETGF